MDREWVIEELREAMDQIATVVDSLERDSPDAMSDFYVCITDAYWHLNKAWNSLGVDTVTVETLQDSALMDQWYRFPESINLPPETT